MVRPDPLRCQPTGHHHASRPRPLYPGSAIRNIGANYLNTAIVWDGYWHTCLVTLFSSLMQSKGRAAARVSTREEMPVSSSRSPPGSSSLDPYSPALQHSYRSVSY